MSDTNIKSHALTWYTNDLREKVEDMSVEQREKFYQVAGQSERDLRIWLEAFFEQISDGLVEEINNQMYDSINETIEEL